MSTLTYDYFEIPIPCMREIAFQMSFIMLHFYECKHFRTSFATLIILHFKLILPFTKTCCCLIYSYNMHFIWQGWLWLFAHNSMWKIFCSENALGITIKTYLKILLIQWHPRKQSLQGQHGAHLGPLSPRWAPCWPHESCYQGYFRFCKEFSMQRVESYLLLIKYLAKPWWLAPRCVGGSINYRSATICCDISLAILPIRIFATVFKIVDYSKKG